MLALPVCRISVRAELVEGRTPSMLRQAQHERGLGHGISTRQPLPL